MRELDLSWASIEDGRPARWDRAESAIAGFSDEDKERLEEHGPRMPVDGMSVSAVRDALYEALREFKEVVENGRPPATSIFTGPLRVYLVDYDFEHDLFEQFDLLRFSGVLIPAGFSDDR